MALGKLADANLAQFMTLTGGAWAAALPLSNLKIAPYKSLPARQLAPTDLGSSQFDATFDRARRVGFVGLTFHTLSLLATYRISVAGIGGSLATPVYQSAWLNVFPRFNRSMDLAWESPNWWTGRPLVEDIDLRPRNLWIVLPTTILTPAIRIEIDDHTNIAGYFDIGYLWASDSWTPTFNFERGRKRGFTPRDQQDEAPSGRIFTEARTGRRTLNLSWTGLTDTEADRLSDAQARAQGGNPMVFLPDTDSYAVTAREAFVGALVLEGPTFTYSGAHQATATITEIIA
ncbi:MAG TPA: hypothetical protein VG960_01515 [Caulobacteraceae bacterium]|nr:hypothetical protein [Caulobacteraceae bacterium]